MVTELYWFPSALTGFIRPQQLTGTLLARYPVLSKFVVFRIIINHDDGVTTTREALSFIFCSRLSGPLTMAFKKTEK